MKALEKYTEKVYSNLKNKILDGTFQPRQRMYENELVKEFKINRAHIRAALARLKQEKFVYVIPRKGAYVSPITKKEILDIFEIRECLEPLAAGKSIENLPLEEFRKTKIEFLKFDDLPVDYQNKLEYLSIDRRFHCLLFKNCNNERLKELLIHFQEHMKRFQKYALNIDSFKVSIREHLDIIDSIEKGDINLIKENLLKHLKRVKKSYFYQFME